MNQKQSSHQDNARFIPAPSRLEEPRGWETDDCNSLVERARLEAAAIAWSTDFPFLVLPCLTEELENEARDYAEKQRHIREKSARLFPQTFPVAARRLAA